MFLNFISKPKTTGKLPSNDSDMIGVHKCQSLIFKQATHGPIRYHSCSRYDLTMTICTIYEIKLAINMLPQLCCKVMTLVKKIPLAQQEDQEDKQTGYFLTGKVIFDRNIESTFSSMWE